MIVHDLLDAAKFMAPIGAGVALLWLLGRDQDDDYTVDDYRPSVEVHLAGDAEPFAAAVRDVRRRLRPADVLPPAPAGTDAGSPLYVETLFRTWHPDAPDVVAGRMLREIAADEQAKTGDLIWQRATDRDLTGSFPVVRAA